MKKAILRAASQSRHIISCGAAAVAVLLASVGLAAAQAQQTPSFKLGEARANETGKAMEAECTAALGTKGKGRAKNWKTSVSLAQDNWAFIVDGAKLNCIPAVHCGTGGCAITVISISSGVTKTIFEQQARQWSIIRPVGVTPYIKLDQHGGGCGKAGHEACGQKLDLLTGKTSRLP